MNFKIIPNEQTPKAPKIKKLQEYIKKNKENLNEFLDFANLQTTAVGLAANQIELAGERLNQRFIALRDLKTEKFFLVFNPQIISYLKAKTIKEEYCLTWKGEKLFAERYYSVCVVYYDINCKRVQKEYNGFEAQVWQHEIDHLNGIKENVVDLQAKLPKRIKIGRNDLCPCGSQKKYKKCCIELY